MKEITYEDWQKNPTPRMMWVWDDNELNKIQRKVIYFNENNTLYPVIILSSDSSCSIHYKHCAEIKTQRRMTNKELARWLREKPTRELKYYRVNGWVYSTHIYKECYEDKEVDEGVIVRENDGEWREPLVEVEE